MAFAWATEQKPSERRPSARDAARHMPGRSQTRQAEPGRHGSQSAESETTDKERES